LGQIQVPITSHLKVDFHEDEEMGWITSYSFEPDGYYAMIHYYYPKPHHLQEVQKDYIHRYFQDFERMLRASDFKDPVTGYQNWIDEDSWVDFILTNEFGNNVDAYSLSTFF